MQTNYLGTALIIILLISDVIALFMLARLNLPPIARAIWAMVILLFPALGVIAFIVGTWGNKRPVA